MDEEDGGAGTVVWCASLPALQLELHNVQFPHLILCSGKGARDV